MHNALIISGIFDNLYCFLTVLIHPCTVILYFISIWHKFLKDIFFDKTQENMSTSEPDQKKARKTKGLSEYITIIKDSILNSIDYIHEAIAEEIAKFTEDNLIECEDCCEQTVNINNPMNHCKNCGKIYCELCQKHELCNQGKHCLDCTKKEFIPLRRYRRYS